MLGLKHRTSRTVNAPMEACRACALRPESLFSGSRYVYSVKRVDGDVYEVVFRWVKFGVERFYVARLRVEARGDELVYESTPDSPLRARFRLKLEAGEGEGTTRLVLEAEMRAGVAAGLLGRGDYRVFVEELLENLVMEAIKDAAEAREASAPGRPDCRRCLLYDPEKRRCYLLGVNVEDPGRPPCRGEKFVERPEAL